jgi:hypothetical protein
MKARFLNLLLAFAILTFSSIPVLSQNETGNQLLNKVYQKIQKAKDYSVTANIKVDMPFIKMIPIDVKIYFKQKDKFKVESKSIALVPRQGFDQLSKMLSDSNQFTCMVQGIEMIGPTTTKIINIIPLSDTTDIILGKLWVDPIQNIVLKLQLTTKTSGTIVTEYSYLEQILYGLPDEMIFTIDVKKFKLPKIMGTDTQKEKVDTKNKEPEKKKGKIVVKLSNYKINKGIPDDFFLDKKK